MGRKLLPDSRLVLASHNRGKLVELADLLRPISPLSPLWTLTNELIFDTNTGEWALGKPLRRPRYGGRYTPVPPPAGH